MNVKPSFDKLSFNSIFQIIVMLTQKTFTKNKYFVLFQNKKIRLQKLPVHSNQKAFLAAEHPRGPFHPLSILHVHVLFFHMKLIQTKLYFLYLGQDMLQILL